MDLKARRPGIEIVAEWIAACCLGAAAGFAVLRLTPLGAAGAVGAAIFLAAAALAVLGQVDRDLGASAARFEPVDLPGEDEVLLLDERVQADPASLDKPVETGELLLDTPLAQGEGSRVVRLFGDAPQPAQNAAPIPAPGEMLARIEDFLGVARGSAAAAEPAPNANVASAEASAALHAALADIRRSLRQA
jgi:hypothetical protein